jgi:hypothetical protein
MGNKQLRYSVAESVRTRANQKRKVLMFGDFIAAAYRAWGTPRARGFVRLAVNGRLLEFRGRERFVIVEG